MKIVQIVFPISSSKNIYFSINCVSCMHVARTWGVSLRSMTGPFLGFKIENVEIVCSQWALPEPTPNNKNSMSVDECFCMTISTVGRIFKFKQAPSFGCHVKDCNLVMIFLAIISSKYIKLVFVESCWMVFLCWGLNLAFFFEFYHFPFLWSFNKRVRRLIYTFALRGCGLQTRIKLTDILRERRLLFFKIIPFIIPLRLATNQLIFSILLVCPAQKRIVSASLFLGI